MKEKLKKIKETLKSFRKTRICSFIMILIVIAICIFVGMGIAFYQHTNDPTDVGSKYLRAFIMKDYDTMYKMLDKDTTNISKKKYVEKMSSLRQSYKIDSYDIGKVESKGGTQYIKMTCTNDQTKEKKDFTVYFSKHGFFNPTYLIDLSKVNEDEEMMASEYKNTLSTSSDLVMNKYYTAVRNNDRKCNDLLNLFSNKKIIKSKVKLIVEKNIKSLTKGTKKVKKYEIKDINLNSLKKSFKYNAKKKQFTVVYSYNYNYKSTTKTSVSNSYVYNKKGKRKATMVLTYNYANDNTSLVDIKIIDKKKK